MTVTGYDKITAGAVSLSALLPNLFTNDLTTPVVGVGVTTVVGAVLGTCSAIGYDENAQRGGRLYIRALSTVIIASTLVGAVPRWAGWEWSSGGTEAALAALSAVLLYFLLAPSIKRARKLIDEFKISDLIHFRKGGVPPTIDPSNPEDFDK